MARRARVSLFGWLALLAGCSPGIGIDGQGSTFVEPVMKAWAQQYYEHTDHRIRINYQGTGSGAGIQQLLRRTTSFACSDLPLNASQLRDANGPVIQLPVALGAIVAVYHLDGLDGPLTLSGPLLARIYLGKITRWNDPELVAANPGLRMPDLAIQPVYRADSSGSTHILTEFLSKASPDFAASVGCSTAPTWPDGHGIAQARTDGVAGYVVRTNGAIGYVEYGYALVAKMQFARLRNRSGQVNEVTAASIAAAVPTRFPAETKSGDPTSGMVLTMSLTDAAAPDAYPMSALSYLILRSGHRPERQREIVRFLIWCLSDEGQAIAARRHCVPFPPALTEAMSSRLSALATPAP